MPTSDINNNAIHDLGTFLHSLEEYLNIRYFYASHTATQKQIKSASDLRHALLQDVGRFKTLIKDLTDNEKVTILNNGKEHSVDMWLRGLAAQWDKTTSDVLMRCIDVTRLAIGKLEDDVRSGYRNNRGIVQQSIIIDQTSEKVLERLVNRFYLVAKEMNNRYDSRPTFDINDEYDAQDLMRSLLKLYFDDVRKEEWTPSYAGGSSRMDFLLKSEQIVVELKMTRKNLNDKEVGAQLLVDIARYQVHPDCKTLVCFVYDPQGFIANPTGLENDLNKLSNNLRVYIRPK